MLFRIDSIGYGFLLYLFIAWLDQRVRSNAIRIVCAGTLFVALSIVVFDATLTLGEVPSRLNEELFPLYAAGFGMTAIAFFHAIGPLYGRYRLPTRFGLFMGQISYSTYLFHLLVATILVPALAAWSMGQQIGLYVAVIAVATYFFYRYFESPILSARPRYTRTVALPSDPELAAAPQGE